MALNEKSFHFIICNMDILNLETLAKWYLDLNTDGKVPALVMNNDKNGIVAGASNILAKLFSDENRSESEQNLLDSLDQILIGHLTIGALLHGPKMNLVTKPPYILAVRNMILNHEVKMYDKVIKMAHKSEEKYQTKMLQVATSQDKRLKMISSESNFLQLLNNLDQPMEKANEYLKSVNFKDSWMFGPKLRLIDITLGLLLYRLDALGLEKRLWENGKNENLRIFYEKFITVPSFLLSRTKNFLNVVHNEWNKTKDE